MNTQKTVKQHLQILPLQKRLQAIENIRRQSTCGFKYDLSYRIEKRLALIGSVAFVLTKQGHDYWRNINNKYFI